MKFLRKASKNLCKNVEIFAIYFLRKDGALGKKSRGGGNCARRHMCEYNDRLSDEKLSKNLIFKRRTRFDI